MTSIKLRPGTFEDFSLLVDWSFDEFEWELSPHDFYVYNNFLPHEWFWVAENNLGETVGFISAVSHGPKDGYVGLFFVRKDQRGNGVGKILFDKALEVLDGKNIGLVTEPHNLKRYTKIGFTVLPDYTLGTSEGYTTQEIMNQDYNVNGITLDEPTQATIQKIIQYDSVVVGRDRSSWCTQHLLHNPHTTSLISFDANEAVNGYGSAKDIGQGKLKFGPIYADTEEIAKMLVFRLLSKYAKNSNDFKLCMFCMCPNKERARNCIADTLAIPMPYPMTHLFTHRVPVFDKQKVFCLADCDVNLV